MQAGVDFSFCEKLQLDYLQGSNWPCCSALSTRDRSQEGIEGGRGGFNLLAPLRNLMTQSCFPTNFPSTGSGLAAIVATYVKDGGRQPSLQPLLQKGQYDSDRALPGVFSVRRIPFNEQVQLQGVSVSRRQSSRRSDGVDSLLE